MNLTEQMKKLIEGLPTKDVTSVGGLSLIENPHLPEHIVVFSDGEHFHIFNIETEQVTKMKIPSFDLRAWKFSK